MKPWMLSLANVSAQNRGAVTVNDEILKEGGGDAIVSA